MTSYRILIAAILVASSSGVGCLVAPVDSLDGVGTAEQEIVIANGNCPDYFWDPTTIQSIRSMAMAPIADSDGYMVNNPFTGTSDGQRLLGYAVGCALREGEVLKHPGTGMIYEGSAGLAPKWTTEPVDAVSTQRWLTACLLQTLNATCQSVSIHMTGANEALADDPAEDVSDYTYADATMFGNLFEGAGPVAYACADQNLVDACGAAWSDDAELRVCDTSPSCQLTLVGECDGACGDDGKGNWVCKDPSGNIWTETISTTLTKSGFQSMYADCPL